MTYRHQRTVESRVNVAIALAGAFLVGYMVAKMPERIAEKKALIEVASARP